MGARAAILWLRGLRSGEVSGEAKTGKPDRDPARIRRLRADAARPMSVNLAEGIALSHKLMRFAGSARRG